MPGSPSLRAALRRSAGDDKWGLWYREADRGMGGRVKRLLLAPVLLISATIYSAADQHERQWKAVPGHPRLFVDMNSIRPMKTEEVCHNPPFIPVDTTVDIRRNGKRESLWLNCEPPRCVEIEVSKLERAVMPVVCPVRSRLHP